MVGHYLVFFAIVGLSMAKPAEVTQDIQKLDKATAEDVDINSIQPDVQKINPGDVSIVTAGVSGTIQPGTSQSPGQTSTKVVEKFPPETYPTAGQGGAFARLINDIFQIPITVLQSVTRLLTNPFVAQNKP